MSRRGYAASRARQLFHDSLVTAISRSRRRHVRVRSDRGGDEIRSDDRWDKKDNDNDNWRKEEGRMWKKRWRRKKKGRKGEKEEERRRRRETQRVSHEKSKSESNRQFPRMLGSNWEHQEVPHESLPRVWVFGSFFPFFPSVSVFLQCRSLSLRGFLWLVALSLSLSLPISISLFPASFILVSLVRADDGAAFVGPQGPWEAVAVVSRVGRPLT